jgi:hypothetical protein
MRGDKWRMNIENEEWEFDNIDIMKSYLNNMIEGKRMFGNINKKYHFDKEDYKKEFLCNICGETHGKK